MKLLSLLSFVALSATSTAQSGTTVVTVNGEEVSQQEYYRKMEYLPGLGRPYKDGGFVEILPGIATLDALITERVLLQVAKSKNLYPTESEVDNEIKFRLAADPNLLTGWKMTGRTDAEYRRRILLEVAQYKLQTEGVTVDDKSIKDLYDVSKGTRYTLPQRYVLRVITLRNDTEQKQVDAELKAGKSFASVAALFSIDESRLTGGKFGEVPLTMLSQGLRDALSKVKKGGQTSWIASDKGTFTKFFVDDILAESVRPLDSLLKEELKRELAVRKGQMKNNVAKLIKDARTSAKIQIASPEFDEAYKRFMGSDTKSGG